MHNIYFIAGASGSGKTALIPYLKKILGNNIAIYDFDDIGVPTGADKKWRAESTEKWLQKLLCEERDACLLGQTVLGEIISCPSAKSLGKINFCLLDVDDFERIKRRGTDIDQNMLNWSAWLRMHHQSPQWQLEAIKDGAWHGLDFSLLDKLDSWSEKANIKIIDTTELKLDEVATKVACLIKNRDPILSSR